MRSIKVAVADDEPAALRRVARMVEACPGVQLIGRHPTARALLQSLQQDLPDVAVVDIRMPGMDGLELARELRRDGITVIFLTAYAEHGAEAFRVAAVDYILKPASQEDIAEALDRARRDRISRTIVDLANGMPGAAGASEQGARKEVRIRVTRGEVVEDLRLSEIVHLRARNQYVEISTQSKRYVISGSLSRFLRRPGVNEMFLRVHRSHAVRPESVREVRRREGTVQLQLLNGDQVPVSRSYRHLLDRLL